jgi:hypothetical protein
MSRYIYRCTRDIVSKKITWTVMAEERAFTLALKYRQPNGEQSYVYEKFSDVDSLQKRFQAYTYGYCHQCGHIDFCPRSNFATMLHSEPSTMEPKSQTDIKSQSDPPETKPRKHWAHLILTAP